MRIMPPLFGRYLLWLLRHFESTAILRATFIAVAN